MTQWVRFQCQTEGVINQKSNSTKIQTQKLIQKWSRILYVSGCRFIPKNSTCEVQLRKKETAQTSRKRYWSTCAFRVVVDRHYALAAIQSKVGAAKAKTALAQFEQHQNPSDDQYEQSWLTYFQKLGPVSCPGLLYLQECLVSVCWRWYVDKFRTALVATGLANSDIQTTTNLLESPDDHVPSQPEQLVNHWLSSPYSPYLQGLSDHGRNLLADRDPDRHREARIRYAAHAFVAKAEKQGNTFVTLKELLYQMRDWRIDSVSVLLASDHYEPLPMCNSNWIDDVTLTLTGDNIQHKCVAEAEQELAEMWEMDQRPSISPVTPPPSFNSGQKLAFESVYQHPISCITGGPGTGKSWVVQQLCDSWHRTCQGNVIILASYNQPLKHLQREMQKTQLHKPFAFKTITKCRFTRRSVFCNCDVQGQPSQTSSHQPVLIIVEEAGVCTMTDLHHVFKMALQPTYRCPCKRAGEVTIVLVGDDNQLKPLRAGQPFADFIRLYPHRTTRLTENMRITDVPNLAFNIQAIQDGSTELKEGPDFVWFPEVRNLNAENAEEFFQLYLWEFQLETDVVIVYKNSTRKLLNKLLYHKHLSLLGAAPGSGFVAGARVVCKNKDKTNTQVTTGMRGVVVKMVVVSVLVEIGSAQTKQDTQVTVNCDGVCYTTDVGLWDYAYAITAHTAQGSEYDRPFIYSFDDPWPARDWVYTAVSRAKKSVRYLVPAEQHEQMVKINQVRPCLSLLDGDFAGPGKKRLRLDLSVVKPECSS